MILADAHHQVAALSIGQGSDIAQHLADIRRLTAVGSLFVLEMRAFRNMIINQQLKVAERQIVQTATAKDHGLLVESTLGLGAFHLS